VIKIRRLICSYPAHRKSNRFATYYNERRVHAGLGGRTPFERSIEVVRLTDAHASEQGLYISRAKGSNDNIVKWTPRLKAAWEAALAVRAQTRARPTNKGRPIPIRPDQRCVFLSESGTPLTRAGQSSRRYGRKASAIAKASPKYCSSTNVP
jgi:hypothetical protein